MAWVTLELFAAEGACVFHVKKVLLAGARFAILRPGETSDTFCTWRLQVGEDSTVAVDVVSWCCGWSARVCFLLL